MPDTPNPSLDNEPKKNGKSRFDVPPLVTNGKEYQPTCGMPRFRKPVDDSAGPTVQASKPPEALTPGCTTGLIRWDESGGAPLPVLLPTTEAVLTDLPDTEEPLPELARKLAKAGANDSGEELLTSMSSCSAATSRGWHLVRSYAEGVAQEIQSMLPGIEKLVDEYERHKGAVAEYTSVQNGTFREALSAGSLGKSVPLAGWFVGFLGFLFLDFRLAASFVVLDNPERVTDMMTGRIDYMTALGSVAPFVLGPFACLKLFFSQVAPEVYQSRFRTLSRCGFGVIAVLPLVFAAQTGGVLDLAPVGSVSGWEIALGSAFNYCSLIGALMFTTIATLKVHEHYKALLDVVPVRTESFEKLEKRLSRASYSVTACNSILARAKSAIESADAAAKHLDTSYRIEIGAAQATIEAAKAKAFADN